MSAPESLYAGSQVSEMAYMFYNTLGRKAYYDFNGSGFQEGWSLNQNAGPFINLLPEIYLSSTNTISKDHNPKNFEQILPYGFTIC